MRSDSHVETDRKRQQYSAFYYRNSPQSILINGSGPHILEGDYMNREKLKEFYATVAIMSFFTVFALLILNYYNQSRNIIVSAALSFGLVFVICVMGFYSMTKEER